MRKIIVLLTIICLLILAGCQPAATGDETQVVENLPSDPPTQTPTDAPPTATPDPTATLAPTPIPTPSNTFNSAWEDVEVEIPGYLVQKLVQNPFPPSTLGIAFDDQDRLYVAGFEIAIVDPESGQLLDSLGPDELPGLTLADDVVIGPDGSLYWTDWMSGNIGRLAPDGAVTTQFVGIGINPIAFSGDGRLFVGLFGLGDGLFEVDPQLKAAPQKLGGIFSKGLNCFAVEPENQFLYSPNLMAGKVLKIDLNTGDVIAEWEGIPGCVKFDSQGQMFVLTMDTGTLYRIIDFEAKEYEIIGEYPSLVPGIDNFALDSKGNVYASRHNRVILRLLPGGETRQVTQPGLFAPAGVAVMQGENGEDKLYVGDMLYLHQFDAQTGAHEKEFKINSMSLTGSGTQLVMTHYLSLSVLAFNPETGFRRDYLPPFLEPTNALLFQKKIVVAEFGSGSVVRGIGGEFLTEKEVIADGLSIPNGLAATDDDLWVADWETGKVWQIESDGEILNPKVLVVSGLNKPEGMAVDVDGTLLVVESGAGRLTRIDPITGVTSVVFEGMAIGLASHPSWSSPAHYNVSGVAVGANGDIYVSSDREQTIYRLQALP